MSTNLPSHTFSANGHAAPPSPVGEVIDASASVIRAQACSLDGAPPLGAFVRISTDDGVEIVGVVANVETAGIDASARPIMRGHDDVRDDQIYAENPDLPHVLRTTFIVQVVGYFTAEGDLHQYLPPRPPRLHYSVHESSPGEARRFVRGGLMYLATLLRAPEIPADEVIAANVRLAGAMLGEPDTFALAAGRELSQHLRTDYSRLSAILRRMVSVAARPPSEAPGP